MLVADAGEVGELLARRADAGDRRLLAVLLLERRLDLDRAHPPVLRGVLDRDLLVVDQDVDRLVGRAVEHHAVPAGELQVGAEVAAAVGVAPAAGRGALADRLEAVAEDRRARHQAGEEAQHVVGAERVGALGDAVEEQPRADPVAAEVVLVHLLGQLFGGGFALRQPHVQDLAVVGQLFRRRFARHRRSGLRCFAAFDVGHLRSPSPAGRAPAAAAARGARRLPDCARRLSDAARNCTPDPAAPGRIAPAGISRSAKQPRAIRSPAHDDRSSMSRFAPLGQRNFRLLWTGSLLSVTAFMTSFTLVPSIAF